LVPDIRYNHAYTNDPDQVIEEVVVAVLNFVILVQVVAAVMIGHSCATLNVNETANANADVDADVNVDVNVDAAPLTQADLYSL
jgi:hypothetical protein